MEKYTTTDKISADKTEKEKKKIVISNDAYAIADFLEELKQTLERLRLTFR